MILKRWLEWNIEIINSTDYNQTVTNKSILALNNP